MRLLAASEARPAVWRALLKRIVALFVVILIMDLLLFVPAGRLNWPAAWVLSLLYGVSLLAYAVWGTLKAPDLLKERSQVAENVKVWDKAIMAVYTVLFLATLVVAGLDVGRVRWSEMAVGWQALGLVGMVLSGGLIFWTIRTNAYLGRMVRIQEDRGHQVVTGGPYRYVRHPMYAGIILLFPCMTLFLGSWWALVPASLIAPCGPSFPATLSTPSGCVTACSLVCGNCIGRPHAGNAVQQPALGRKD